MQTPFVARVLAVAALAVAPAAFAAGAGTAFSYATGFDAGVGPEWTLSTSYDNGDAGILGQLQDGSATLTLDAPGPGSANLDFDLLGFRTVDGLNCCTDTFRLSINGTLVLEGNFNMGGGGGEQITVNTLGALVGGSGGVRFVSIPSFAIVTGANTVVFDYGAMQGFGDEAWGLDNVSVSGTVTPIPEPGAWALMTAGIGLLALRRRERR